MALTERKEAWFRIIVAIISGIVLSIWKALIQILAIVNWLITIFSGKRNKGLAHFPLYSDTAFAVFLSFGWALLGSLSSKPRVGEMKNTMIQLHLLHSVSSFFKNTIAEVSACNNR